MKLLNPLIIQAEKRTTAKTGERSQMIPNYVYRREKRCVFDFLFCNNVNKSALPKGLLNYSFEFPKHSLPERYLPPYTHTTLGKATAENDLFANILAIYQNICICRFCQ